MSKLRVLVVEDDREMAAMLDATLSADFDVVICTDKAHAITRAKEYLKDHGSPDAVILDLIINGEGGLDLYHWMKDRGYQTSLLFLTGCHPHSPEYQEAVNSGEVVYEKDHFSSKNLVGLLKNMVAAKQAPRAFEFPAGVQQQP